MADEIIQEINEELRAQRLRVVARRVGAVLAGVVLVGGIGGGVWGWRVHALHMAQHAASERYLEAIQSLSKHGPQARTSAQAEQKAEETFTGLAQHGPDGVRSYAAMSLADIKQRHHEGAAALSLWKQVEQDKTSNPALKDMAVYLSLNAQMDTAKPEMLRSGYEELVKKGGSWASLAREGLAVLDMRPGSTDAQRGEARRLLQEVRSSPDSGEALRDRAGLLLQTLGDAG
ncbi:hypothetical protein [Saccharibacter sp. 17.LH.SD]|uniref:hypothetical protein n=1 Tax=Saccharibacter sp. 17.LH.SD TaxID=2689393 RepID=UPI00351B004D